MIVFVLRCAHVNRGRAVSSKMEGLGKKRLLARAQAVFAQPMGPRDLLLGCSGSKAALSESKHYQLRCPFTRCQTVPVRKSLILKDQSTGTGTNL